VRHAIVQVRWGPLSCRKAVVAPGQVLRVGRAESMGLAVPHDKELAEAHFELSWSGNRGWLKSLRGPQGTLLEGQAIEQGEVFNGSWVRAGQTDFSVYFERTTPAQPPKQPEPPELAAHKARALEVLRGQQAPLYAVLDSARSVRILELLHESVEDCRSLYEGPQGDALEEVAPYLVSLSNKKSWLLEALVQEGWEAGWGVYFTHPHPFLEVRRHLRKFLMVELEGAEGRFYFRFYDPRVLREFLPGCDEATREEVFGATGGFILAGPGGEVLEHSNTKQQSSPARAGRRS
jgi:hypothetical protein